MIRDDPNPAPTPDSIRRVAIDIMAGGYHERDRGLRAAGFDVAVCLRAAEREAEDEVACWETQGRGRLATAVIARSLLLDYDQMELDQANAEILRLRGILDMGGTGDEARAAAVASDERRIADGIALMERVLELRAALEGKP